MNTFCTTPVAFLFLLLLLSLPGEDLKKKKKILVLLFSVRQTPCYPPPLCFIYVLINLFWRREGMGPKKNEESVSLSFAKKMFKTLVLD